MTETPKTDEHQDQAPASALPVPAGLDPNTPYTQWSLVECALCGERSPVAEHAEHGTWDEEHAQEKHPDVRRLQLIVWTISRARAMTYLSTRRPRTTDEGQAQA